MSARSARHNVLVGGIGEWVGNIAGGKDRDERLSGLAGTSCRQWRRGEASPSSFRWLHKLSNTCTYQLDQH